MYMILPASIGTWQSNSSSKRWKRPSWRKPCAKDWSLTGSVVPIYALRSEREQLEPLVERIIAARVTAVYQEAGIHTPLDRFIGCPLPSVVWFKLDRLPHLLVVSPRERIESVYEAMLLQDSTRR